MWSKPIKTLLLLRVVAAEAGADEDKFVVTVAVAVVLRETGSLGVDKLPAGAVAAGCTDDGNAWTTAAADEDDNAVDEEELAGRQQLAQEQLLLSLLWKQHWSKVDASTAASREGLGGNVLTAG